MTIVSFLLLEACMMTSGIMKASPEGEGIHVRASSGPLGPVSKVPGIFRNRDLLSTYGEQSRVIAIVCNVLGDSWRNLTNNSNRSFL